MAKQVSFDVFVERARAKHGNRYGYARDRFSKMSELMKIECPVHGTFEQTPYMHAYGRNCPGCGKESSSRKRTYTTEEFIERAIKVHENLYTYERTLYVGKEKKVLVTCGQHGDFSVTPHNHIVAKSGCPSCALISRGDKQRGRKRPGIGGVAAWTGEQFIVAAKKVHGDRFEYDSSKYKNFSTKVQIRCSTHGTYEQLPAVHLRGKGCPRCVVDSRRMSTTEFIRKGSKIHDGKFTYPSTEYGLTQKDKVTITCPVHGDFDQTAGSHLMGHGCRACAAHISGMEQELFEFVRQFCPDAYRGDRKIIAPQELDIVIPNRNLAIEFCGLYWHSEREGKDSRYHLKKHVACEAQNIRLLTIFEDEWDHKRSIVESTLRHLFGHSERGYGARQVQIREIEWAQAKPFIEQHHLLGSGSSGNIRLGAFYRDELIGAMTFGTPSDERGHTDLIEMKRFVTDGRNHPGLGSRMFNHAVKTYGYDHVIAFVDRRWYTGSFKSISGFVPAGITDPTMFWTNTNARFKRRIFDKTELADMDQFKNLDLTKPEMMRRLGYSRIWDCGKIRMEWSAPE